MPVEVSLCTTKHLTEKRNAFRDEINFNGKQWQNEYVCIYAIVCTTYSVKGEGEVSEMREGGWKEEKKERYAYLFVISL